MTIIQRRVFQLRHNPPPDALDLFPSICNLLRMRPTIEELEEIVNDKYRETWSKYKPMDRADGDHATNVALGVLEWVLQKIRGEPTIFDDD